MFKTNLRNAMLRASTSTSPDDSVADRSSAVDAALADLQGQLEGHETAREELQGRLDFATDCLDGQQTAREEAEMMLDDIRQLARFTRELTVADEGTEVARRACDLLMKAAMGEQRPVEVLDLIDELYTAKDVGGTRALTEEEEARVDKLRVVLRGGVRDQERREYVQ
jgi:hypothetical protein